MYCLFGREFDSLQLHKKNPNILKVRIFSYSKKIKSRNYFLFLLYLWPHLGSNQGLADYESATLTN